jgi:hypothetical protein
MKTKLLILGLFILFSSFSSKDRLEVETKKKSSFHIGHFYKDGYYFNAWGNENGIESVDVTDSGGNYLYPVYSFEGTLSDNHYIDISLLVTSTGPPLTFSGYCWF